MAKGIIEIEIPDRCDECPFRHMGLAQCEVLKRSTSHSSTGKPLDQRRRPKWCPIVEKEE